MQLYGENDFMDIWAFLIRIQWNAGTACVSECMLETLACRGLRVGPSAHWGNLKDAKP